MRIALAISKWLIRTFESDMNIVHKKGKAPEKPEKPRTEDIRHPGKETGLFEETHATD